MATPDQIATRWAQRLAASTQEITQGVQGVTRAPGAAAAAQKAVWAQNVQAAQDKWARNVAAVSLTSWQDSMINKGIPRIASGAQAAQPKFQAFMTSLMPYIENGKAQLANTPRGNLQQNIARMNAWVNYMSAYQKPAGS